jgi:hypothetical protein
VLRLVALAVAAVLAVSIYLTALGAGTSRSFELGVVSNADPTLVAARIGRLGVPIARVEFPISASPARLAPVIAAFARRHIRVLPLAGFRGRMPSSEEVRNLASWAHAFGPSGSYWVHHGGGSLAIRDIEFGNETNQAYQYNCGPGCSSFAARGHAYALAVKQAAEAVAGAQGNPGVGVLAIADNGGTGSPEWVNAMFDAVPDLASRVAGWTAHPYGPRGQWQAALDQLIAETQARGAPVSVPIYITEIGIATDNGRCLQNNFGWNPCMTYAETGAALASTVSAIRARYGTRIRAMFIYQALDQRLPRVDSDREHYFGILTANGAAKGALTATFRSLVRSQH